MGGDDAARCWVPYCAHTRVEKAVQRTINVVIRLFDRYMPEPFAFGVLMTLVAMVLTFGATQASPMEIVVAWGDGLSSLLSFITQVCLTIMFAYALGHLGPVPRLLQRLAGVQLFPHCCNTHCMRGSWALC